MEQIEYLIVPKDKEIRASFFNFVKNNVQNTYVLYVKLSMARIIS